MTSALEGAVAVCWRRGCLCAGGMFLPVEEALITCWRRHRVSIKGVIGYVEEYLKCMCWRRCQLTIGGGVGACAAGGVFRAASTDMTVGGATCRGDSTFSLCS